jgi:tetratricopeptide (TPR) repeat protein
MCLLPIRTRLRESWLFAVVVVTILALTFGELHPGSRRDRVISDADALPYRVMEARLADGFEYRPFRRVEDISRTDLFSLRSTAVVLRERWHAVRDQTAGRKSAQAQMLAGNSEAAAALLTDVLKQDSGRTDLLSAIHTSRSAPLLTDFSAAMLQRQGNARLVVLAFEAANRAWQLVRTPEAAWNRALAAQRLGVPALSVNAWHDAAALETSPDWKRDARQREEASERVIHRVTESPEFFFHQHLIASAAAGVRLADLLPGDRLASDTASAVSIMDRHNRQRLRSALRMYADGRDAFARDDLDHACAAMSAAERELLSLRMPLALLVREQHIRCRCMRAEPGCLYRIRAMRAELVPLGRYPWLVARLAYAEGQTLYRQGRIYDAAEAFQSALEEFLAVGDAASAGLTHSVLGNTYSAAGETDAALEHHLAAVRLRFTYAGDRRRIQLEDAMLFLIRTGYVATAELLLDELSCAPVTDGGRVMEAVLRGVTDFRGGNSQKAQEHFAHAHRLLGQVNDATLREEAKQLVVLAESGCGVGPSRPSFADIDAAAAFTEREEISLWLPRMLTERGIEFEKANEPARAEEDFRRAMSILERREPRIDQSSLTLGTVMARESVFDHAIRLYLKQQRISAALSAAQRSISIRISSLHGRVTGVRDVFRSDRINEGGEGQDIRKVLPVGHVAVAQYLLTDAVITWIVTPTSIRAVRRPVAAEQLIDAVGDLHACASRGGCDDGPELERVSTLLLRDWIELVPRGAALWLQRPVELQALPYSMLKTRDGEQLLSRNPLTHGSTFAALVRAYRLDTMREGDVTALFVAVPRPPADLEPLPMTTVEVRRAARFYQTVLVDESATRRTFVESVSRCKITHFAGHVLVNDEQPLLSALAFRDGLLYIHELDGHAWSGVRLVVLSGCDSGRTPKPMMSVANALLSQGVPSVVYTLWPVEDPVAADFAVAFHRALSAGKSRAESLQSAALSVRQRTPGRPSAWAAFQLAGAPGPINTSMAKESPHGRKQETRGRDGVQRSNRLRPSAS